MVHVIVMPQSTQEQRTQAEVLFVQHNNGWQRVRPGVWLLATEVAAADWRNFLGVQVPGAEFLIAQLEGEWGSIGLHQVGQWLTAADGWF